MQSLLSFSVYSNIWMFSITLPHPPPSNADESEAVPNSTRNNAETGMKIFFINPPVIKPCSNGITSKLLVNYLLVLNFVPLRVKLNGGRACPNGPQYRFMLGCSGCGGLTIAVYNAQLRKQGGFSHLQEESGKTASAIHFRFRVYGTGNVSGYGGGQSARGNGCVRGSSLP